MKKLVFATNNAHKLNEARSILSDQYEIISLAELGFSDDIPETSDTIEGNASLKSCFISEKFGMDCFADDTGLEVEALDGKPGVYSARFAGEGCSYNDNVVKLLSELKGETNRRAQFKTVISAIIDGNEPLFEGIIPGEITKEKRGDAGFGYDPVFIPDGYRQTFAEMSPELKNTISHRALAMQKLRKKLL